MSSYPIVVVIIYSKRKKKKKKKKKQYSYIIETATKSRKNRRGVLIY
eukprot:CAMPEP_0202446534 /NCGR_PEP_ID=MMETSP1360-20130828/5034_1 /ASSEMBLY_ACC=CAM_ASM_000848 /TAXON_ID=515479 /ORGANISM="Licmophora paradoxa, Strain CCMP2313" /LENGTH=46 /DNA_ID= /DNA_START= /DNA_END= /DNA_ORIENTATION=